jgi:sensor histidine kinase regulating citrate/malate metabolism
LTEYELYTLQLQEQLERQIRHDSSHRKDTEDFRKFKHDYKDMMISVKTLIRNGKNDEALQLMDEIYDTMQAAVSPHRVYSDHVIIDAILQDTANTCAAKQIEFSARVPFPPKDVLTDLDKVRIFTNIIHNAVEACEKLPDGARYIKIASNYSDDWLFIQIINSYDGKSAYTGKGLETTKNDKYLHGFGLNIVRDIIEGKLEGVVLIETDQMKREFQIKLSIPLSAPIQKEMAFAGQTGDALP